MITPRYLTDARHAIFSPAILTFQSGSLLLYHNASHLSGENLRPSCIDLVSTLVQWSSVCVIRHVRWGPHGLPDHQRMRSFVLCYPGSFVVVY